VVEAAVRETVARFSEFLEDKEIRERITATLAIADGLLERTPKDDTSCISPAVW
jgi:hypothetical protein